MQQRLRIFNSFRAIIYSSRGRERGPKPQTPSENVKKDFDLYQAWHVGVFLFFLHLPSVFFSPPKQHYLRIFNSFMAILFILRPRKGSSSQSLERIKVALTLT